MQLMDHLGRLSSLLCQHCSDTVAPLAPKEQLTLQRSQRLMPFGWPCWTDLIVFGTWYILCRKEEEGGGQISHNHGIG